MYLKEINAHGFKSFADKTLIELSNNITGIVGPNGSGKSNIVDAIRWVLGEQSVKSLRGDGNMTDVIFSGSKSRNSSSYASVTLVFDNMDHFLPFDFNEVAIKRRLYKDGTNEYFLNNEKVRLKDINNILLDSGMAKESFNIISQGKIEEILSNKPEERRIIFEEAAGVLKYKRRKEEALRKLDKTNDNMNRIDDIINELSLQIEPLKEQKEKALMYQKINDELKNIEVALIVDDINNLNFEYQKSKTKIEDLNITLSKISTNNSIKEAKILEYKNNISKLDNLIRTSQEELIKLSTKTEQINSQKKIILERQKYSVPDSKIHDNIIALKEKSLNLTNNLSNLTNLFKNIELEIIELNKKINIENDSLNEIKDKKKKLEFSLSSLLREQNNYNIQIETLKYSIDNNSIPLAVKKVLSNPKLKGVHDIVGNLFDVEEKYSLAIGTAISSLMVNVVVDDELSAKECINYLKTNNAGRVTFLPLNIIKPKYIDEKTLDIINIDGLIGIASNLISYDKKYTNILLNLLGNTIVVKDIDTANYLAKKINYRFRIVTLDGTILNVGGAITGGNAIKNHNIILEKYELEKKIKELNDILENIKKNEEEINLIDDKYREFEDKIYLINKNKIDKEVILNNYKENIISLKEQIKEINFEIESDNNILNNNLSSEEERIIKEYYECLKEKDDLTLKLNNLIKSKDELNDELSIYELENKKDNTLYNNISLELKNLEIITNRLDVKLDNLLNVLNETYTLTYEEALSKYKLEIPSNTARNKVINLKKQIREIGVVNIASIEEFDRVNERYNFLLNQKSDLIKASNTLLEIINEMDKVMEREFKNTFKVIKENFVVTFKELFKGGEASLKLTDPENILQTGIEIVASPPGKKLTTISLLSGGEKTFTAISLLFAILKSKPVPFCILDEVEAALDDVNVDSFGSYVKKLKEKTQFIIITHKKKTMEYVDTLYGITMQESGVSKLVSVKLAG